MNGGEKKGGGGIPLLQLVCTIYDFIQSFERIQEYGKKKEKKLGIKKKNLKKGKRGGKKLL